MGKSEYLNYMNLTFKNSLSSFKALKPYSCPQQKWDEMIAKSEESFSRICESHSQETPSSIIVNKCFEVLSKNLSQLLEDIK